LRRGHTAVQIPASAGIFAEVAGQQLKVLQANTIPEREPASREVDLARVVSNGSDLERNPAARAARAAASPSGELDLAMLSATARVSLGDLLHRLHGHARRTPRASPPSRTAKNRIPTKSAVRARTRGRR
jgi:hypothetical protein